MIGILSYGVYIPVWRMQREMIACAEGIFSAGGERSVAGFDEDSVSMAVEAGLDCLGVIDPKEIDALYFATISPALAQKQSASFIAMGLDLREDIATYDITDSQRASTLALKAAYDAVKSGSIKNALVVTADRRPTAPKSMMEQLYGDGAAAILIGNGKPVALIFDIVNLYEPVLGMWRRDYDEFPVTFDQRIDKRKGIMTIVPETVAALLSKNKLEAMDVAKFAIGITDPGSYIELARLMKVDLLKQLVDPLVTTIGMTGTPHCLILLASALENAGPNDKIVCVNYSDGCDAMLINTTDEITKVKPVRKITDYIQSKKMVASYGRFRDMVEAGEKKSLRKQGVPSLIQYWRDKKWGVRRYGMRCNKCGTLKYPIDVCCIKCDAKDDHTDVKISRKGKVFTYAHDMLLGPGSTPADGFNFTTRTVLNMDDGFRMAVEMTDNTQQEVDINMPVELTFRLLHEKGDFPCYGWRSRPVR
jgi:3-hydroxy-3-methylglutaryl CoA synthase